MFNVYDFSEEMPVFKFSENDGNMRDEDLSMIERELYYPYS